MASELVDMRQLLDSKSSDLEGLLSGSGVTLERFKATVFQLFDRESSLRQCRPDSIIAGVMAVADVGLTFTPSLGHAYLIKYGDQAVPVIGYRGLIHLARRSGAALDIRPGIRRSNDHFKLHPLNPREPIEHEPADIMSAILGYYCVAFLPSGLARAEYMSKQQVEKHRDKYSKTGWKNFDFDEMAMKTVVRKLCKYLPLSGQLEKAMTVNDVTDYQMGDHDALEVTSVANDLDNPLPDDAPRRVEPEVMRDAPIGDSSNDYRDILALSKAAKLSMRELCDLLEGNLGIDSPELIRQSQVSTVTKLIADLRK